MSNNIIEEIVMRKKIISLAVAIMVLLLACGKGNKDAGTTETVSEATNDVTISKMYTQKATIDETVLLEDENVKVTALKLDYPDNYKANVHLSIENKSDLNLHISSGLADSMRNAINGYVTVPLDSISFFADVPAKSTIEQILTYPDEYVRYYGITDIAELQYIFKIKLDYTMEPDYYEGMEQSDNFDRKKYEYLSDIVSLKTSIYDSYDMSKDTFAESVKSGEWQAFYSYEIHQSIHETVMEQDGLKISSVVNAAHGNKHWLFLEVENVSDKTIYVSIDNMVVDGYNINTIQGMYLLPGNRSIMVFNLYHNIWSKIPDVIDLNNIGTISFDYRYDSSDGNGLWEDIGTMEIVLDESVVPKEVDGTVVYDDSGLLLKALDPIDDGESYTFPIYVENETGYLTWFDDDYKIIINGQELPAKLEDCSCYDGQKTVIDIGVGKETLKSIGVEKLEDITSIKKTLKYSVEETYKYKDAVIEY